MTTTLTLADLSPVRQREIFAEVVSCQDAGMTPEQSRQQLASYYSVSIETIKHVEALGIAKCWPPL